MRKSVLITGASSGIGREIVRILASSYDVIIHYNNNYESALELKKEIAILEEYMPEQLSEEELNKIIDKVFLEVKPTSMKDMGNIMKAISPLVKGKADMSDVNKLIKERLS